MSARFPGLSFAEALCRASGSSWRESERGTAGAVAVLLRAALREPLIEVADDAQD